MPWSMWPFVELDCLLMPPDDDTKLNSFLESIDSEVKASGMRSLRKSQREPESNLRRFVRLNWMSVLLLSQALLIIVLFGSLIAYPTLLAAVSYFILLLLRWLNYPLVVSALFHDEKKMVGRYCGDFIYFVFVNRAAMGDTIGRRFGRATSLGDRRPL